MPLPSLTSNITTPLLLLLLQLFFFLCRRLTAPPLPTAFSTAPPAPANAANLTTLLECLMAQSSCNAYPPTPPTALKVRHCQSRLLMVQISHNVWFSTVPHLPLHVHPATLLCTVEAHQSQQNAAQPPMRHRRCQMTSVHHHTRRSGWLCKTAERSLGAWTLAAASMSVLQVPPN
jgi:hypothetical protein